MLESTLRALGDRVPSGIAAERHDLGEVTRDPRWIESPRYGRRLRSNVDAMNEWRYGDIVRMGYIPTAATPGTLRRSRSTPTPKAFAIARCASGSTSRRSATRSPTR